MIAPAFTVNNENLYGLLAIVGIIAVVVWIVRH